MIVDKSIVSNSDDTGQTCPYCGHMEDDPEFIAYEETWGMLYVTCSKCVKDFRLEVDVYQIWTSCPAECVENAHRWNAWEKLPGTNREIRYCEICGDDQIQESIAK